MTPRERGERAKDLLEDPVLNQVLSDIREGIVTQVEASAFGDRDTHHEAAISLQLLKRIKTRLKHYVDNMAMEAHKAKEAEFLRTMKESINIR